MADMTTSERERAVIAAYRAGAKITDIERKYSVGRSTLYHILRREGVTPQRSKRHTEAGDARLAGLAELIAHQDQLIAELQANAELARKRTAKLERENSALRARLPDSDGAKRRRTVS